jgi:50S ribosomal subunit-associated GTPase HflX
LKVDPKKIVLVLNKIDLLNDTNSSIIQRADFFRDFSTVKISAVRGDGVHQLKNRIVENVFAHA